MVSAPPLHVFLPPESAPEASPEHTCPCRPPGAQVLMMGMAAGASMARGGFVGDGAQAHWSLHRGSFGRGGAQVHWGLHRRRSLWLEVWVSLLRQMSLLLPAEAGAGGWRSGLQWQPSLCTPLNNGALFLRWSGLLLQTFLVVELLSPIPSVCLFTANSCPLPGSTLQAPLSSTQPPSTPGDT